MMHAEHNVWNYPALFGGTVFMSSSTRGRKKKNQNKIMPCAGYLKIFWTYFKIKLPQIKRKMSFIVALFAKLEG